MRTQFLVGTGGGTAVYTPGNSPAYYRHSDWLGSSRLATTPTRTNYYDGAYAPFGESYAGSGTTDPNFTGQNQDTVSGLYDFVFREYNPAHGRWISPDPAGLGAVSLANPQTWNRYAYVGNNPLNAVDPLGLFKGDALGNGDDGCYLTFSCTVFVDEFGMQIDSQFAQEALHNGSGAICPQCAVTSVRGGGFAFASVGADDSIGWSFSFSAGYLASDGNVYPRSAEWLAEVLGLPSNLPQSTPKKYWDPFEQG